MERKYLSAQHRLACENIDRKRDEQERKQHQTQVEAVAVKIGARFGVLK